MTIYEQRLREWRDPSLWLASTLTPNNIAAMTGATPNAVCRWIRKNRLPAQEVQLTKGITYHVKPYIWLAWANENRPRIFMMALEKPRACPRSEWGGAWVKPEVSPIVTVDDLVKLEGVTPATVWRACKRGLPHGSHGAKTVVALADWHWWRARNAVKK